MTHDPLCKFSKRKAADDHYDDGCDYCDLIAKVRADERREIALSLRFAAKIQAVDGTAIDATSADLLRRCADIIAVWGEAS